MKTYFAAFIPSDGQCSVLFADFELAAQGDTLEDAFAAAQDALRGRTKCMVEDREALPEASDMARARDKIALWCREEGMELPEGTLYQMVPCDVPATRLVRVNVSFPETVLERIDAKARLAGMSRSGFLAAAQAYS